MNVTAVVNLPRTPFGFTSTLVNDSKRQQGQYFGKRMAVAAPARILTIALYFVSTMLVYYLEGSKDDDGDSPLPMQISDKY